ncbi:hypothetical protein BD410DRAFT_791314 [Rickenella mellea]|uniref:Uncharacterized protein n=1 Tax=Rickenella mellea TaxID=50990 RepID=A0A4Y7PXS1_9AGAM|nr:hypothetical protein BD410DRAFT_791314 [Rickenella mellea]
MKRFARCRVSGYLLVLYLQFWSPGYFLMIGVYLKTHHTTYTIDGSTGWTFQRLLARLSLPVGEAPCHDITQVL